MTNLSYYEGAKRLRFYKGSFFINIHALKTYGGKLVKPLYLFFQLSRCLKQLISFIWITMLLSTKICQLLVSIVYNLSGSHFIITWSMAASVHPLTAHVIVLEGIQPMPILEKDFCQLKINISRPILCSRVRAVPLEMNVSVISPFCYILWFNKWAH